MDKTIPYIITTITKILQVQELCWGWMGGLCKFHIWGAFDLPESET